MSNRALVGCSAPFVLDVYEVEASETACDDGLDNDLNGSAEDVPELLIGRGLTYAEAGLRLRYERSEKFAPYVGLSWERSLGRTARMERAADEDPETKSLVFGIRSGF